MFASVCGDGGCSCYKLQGYSEMTFILDCETVKMRPVETMLLSYLVLWHHKTATVVDIGDFPQFVPSLLFLHLLLLP